MNIDVMSQTDIRINTENEITQTENNPSFSKNIHVQCEIIASSSKYGNVYQFITLYIASPIAGNERYGKAFTDKNVVRNLINQKVHALDSGRDSQKPCSSVEDSHVKSSERLEGKLSNFLNIYR